MPSLNWEQLLIIVIIAAVAYSVYKNGVEGLPKIVWALVWGGIGLLVLFWIFGALQAMTPVVR